MQQKQWRLVNYSSIYTGYVRLHDSGDIEERHGRYYGRDFKNKTACLCTNYPSARALDELDRECCLVTVSPISSYNKLFVCPEVRTSRDIIRNSGYKIVRNPDDADYTVVPVPNSDNPFPLLFCNLALVDNETNSLYLYTVVKGFRNTRLDPGEYAANYQKIHDFFCSATYQNWEFVYDSLVENGCVSIISRYQVYSDIISNQYPHKIYVYETYLKKLCPVEFNIEALEIWSKCSDINILEKSICNSNWEEYPATLLIFLKKELTNSSLEGATSRNFQLVLDTIGYDRRKSVETILGDKLIQPKDFNMLQKYIMYKLGVSENGGFTDKFSFYPDYNGLFRVKLAVAPLKLSVPTTFSNILQLLKI